MGDGAWPFGAGRKDPELGPRNEAGTGGTDSAAEAGDGVPPYESGLDTDGTGGGSGDAMPGMVDCMNVAGEHSGPVAGNNAWGEAGGTSGPLAEATAAA